MMNTNYKKIITFLLSLVIFIGSLGFVYNNINNVSAAIEDCTTVVGNLIQNCSFENPNPIPAPFIVDTIGNHRNVFAGYGGLSNWQIISPTQPIDGNVTITDQLAASAAQGSIVVDVSGVIDPAVSLDGEHLDSGVQQSVSGLTIGNSYTFSFYQTHQNVFPSRVGLLIDGTLVQTWGHSAATAGDTIGSLKWTKRTYTFTATSATHTFALTNRYNHLPRTLVNALDRPTSIVDNVSLVAADSVGPVITLSTLEPSPTSNSSFTVTISPSESLLGFTLSDVTVTNGSASGLTGPDLDGNYSVTITASSEGPVTIMVPNGAATDSVGNPSTTVAPVIVTYAVPPTITLSTPSLIVSAPFTVTACPSEPVTGLVLGDFTTSVGTLSNFTGPTASGSCAGGFIYTFDVTPPVTDGPITINIASNTFQDITGNDNQTGASLIVSFDAVTVIINPVTISSNNTNPAFATTGNTISLVYTLDVIPTTNVVTIGTLPADTVNCVPAGGPAPIVCTATLAVGPVNPINGVIPFEITVTAPFSSPQTTINTTDGSSVTIDRLPPVVTITSPVNGSLVTSPFTLTGTCETGLPVVITGTNITPVNTSCTAGTYSTPITAVGDNPSVSVTQTDLAGNTAVPATGLYVMLVAPIVTITGPSGIVNPGTVTTITGTCITTDGNVTISGTGFTPIGGFVPCSGGVFSFPITVTSPTSFTASQTNIIGTGSANGSTSVYSGGSSGGGGCLPGYSCFSNTPSSTPTTPPVATNTAVTATTSTTTNRCPVFTQYLKKGMRDGRNGVSEVSKVQSFLNRKLGLNLSIDGVFGKRTHNAVSDFQSVYFTSVLSPWGLTSPTGWWYQSTRSYANYLENCSEGTVPLDNGVRVQDGVVVN